jgi:2,4-dienoyl-CoA reductase-like NADH-dependent reductase (Old Yellow Enzyme family)
VEKRFQFLREIVLAVRKAVGSDFLFGIRLSAVDFDYLPVNVRWPVVFPLRHYFIGNSLEETLHYGKELPRLGVDYLHISSGFGFINPKESPGAWPVDEYRLYANATRHLSAKANLRAILLNALPAPVLRAIFGFGWGYKPAINVDYARVFKETVGLPVIANGGFQHSMMRSKVLVIPVVLLLIFTGAACSSDSAQALFESAQFEERQNNHPHAKELYQEILTKYPKSEYASKAEKRLRELDQKK